MPRDATVGRIVHVHAKGTCWLGFVTGKDRNGFALVEIHPPQSLSALEVKTLTFNAAAQDDDSRMTYHWPKECPWGR